MIVTNESGRYFLVHTTHTQVRFGLNHCGKMIPDGILVQIPRTLRWWYVLYVENKKTISPIWPLYQAVNQNCPMLQEAMTRYTDIIRKSVQGYIKAPQTAVIRQIQQFSVNLTRTCESMPNSNMDESCRWEGWRQCIVGWMNVFVFLVCSTSQGRAVF